MDRKIRVGAVSYLNTKPLIYGFEKGLMKGTVELSIDFPSGIASKLLNDEIDVGLIPIAAIPELKEYYLVSDYCIAGDGAVASVCLFSDVPLNEIKTILLDYQSRTSVALLKILLNEFWGISPELVDASVGYENLIKGSTAGLVIGDRALQQRLQSKFIYDLGDAWKQMTGLPFVFAAWVSNKPMEDQFIENFNAANEYGLQHMAEVVEQNPFPQFDLKKYYTGFIRFALTIEARKGMDTFLAKMALKSGSEIPFFK